MLITYSGQMPPSSRTRWWVTPGYWEVRARIERFAEPAILLLLQEESRHGYDFLRDIPP